MPKWLQAQAWPWHLVRVPVAARISKSGPLRSIYRHQADAVAGLSIQANFGKNHENICYYSIQSRISEQNEIIDMVMSKLKKMQSWRCLLRE